MLDVLFWWGARVHSAGMLLYLWLCCGVGTAVFGYACLVGIVFVRRPGAYLRHVGGLTGHRCRRYDGAVACTCLAGFLWCWNGVGLVVCHCR